MGPLKATNQVNRDVTNKVKEPKLQSKLETDRKHRSVTWPWEEGNTCVRRGSFENLL